DSVRPPTGDSYGAGANHFFGGSTTRVTGRDGVVTRVFGFAPAFGSLANGTWACPATATVYSAGRAPACTSNVTVASPWPSETVTFPILIGPGNDSGSSVTAPLRSGQSRSTFTFTSTFFPASTSTRSAAGVRVNGAAPPTATTNSRVGRLEPRSGLFHTRVYG